MPRRLLAIDVGNSTIHLGLWQAGAWARPWRIRSEPQRTADEYAALLQGAGPEPGEIDGAVIGSVAPALTATLCDLLPQYLGLRPLVVSHETDCGLRIDIEKPWQAGADRLANAAAAWALHGGAAIVIDFGTATTFDVISADGAWRGGAIAPGAGIARDALAQRTARLPAVDLTPAAASPGPQHGPRHAVRHLLGLRGSGGGPGDAIATLGRRRRARHRHRRPGRTLSAATCR